MFNTPYQHWSEHSIPSQSGRTVVITGANSGLGYATATALARKNARIILACRNPQLAETAAAEISRETGNHNIDVCIVELNKLGSVRYAASQLLAREARIDLLINNAGAMLSELSLSAEGVEMNMAVNYLGHFALTGLLMPRLLATPGSRTVGLSSLGHLLSFGFKPDLIWSSNKKFRPLLAYGHSKFAVLLFIQALNRRLQCMRADTLATAAHPGGAKTELIQSSMAGLSPALARKLLQFQSADDGAQPILRAGYDIGVIGGECFGPRGLLQLSGSAVRVPTRPKVADKRLQDRLWAASEQLCEVQFPF